MIAAPGTNIGIGDAPRIAKPGVRIYEIEMCIWIALRSVRFVRVELHNVSVFLVTTPYMSVEMSSIESDNSRCNRTRSVPCRLLELCPLTLLVETLRTGELI